MSNRNPHFEKIIIGPFMVLGEMITGGHYTETLKIRKQSSNKTYSNITKDLWRRHRYKGFYLGFMPWSVLQTVKGLPVLFVQSETCHLFKKYTSLSEPTRFLFSGILGGMAQGIFVTPTQRVKTIVMTHPKRKYIGSIDIIKETWRNGGLITFFSGLTPMILRRGLDWGLRVYGYKYIEKEIKKVKGNVNVFDKIVCSIGGGFLSTITTPIDTCVAESQKYKKKYKKRNIIQVGKDIYRNYGLRGFVRGWNIRVIHSCYHTIWVYGIGNIIFSWLRDEK